MRPLDQLIAAAPVFAGTRPDHLTVVAGCARNVHVEADTYLLREGHSADTFFLIRRGAVSLEVHVPGRGALVIETLTPGDAVGWSWLFEPYCWQLDARTTAPCSLVAIDGACLRAKCNADHELGYELMRRFAAELVDRLQATRMQLLDVYGDARVAG
jgi:CRP/FNR family transcriptional regulator, cyclic AMP receptor protein